MEVTVLGAGSWGTALALLAARAGHRVRLWGHRPDQVERLRVEGENAVYLPGSPLSAGVSPTSDLERSLAGSDLVLLVTPSHGMRAVVRRARPHLREGVPLVSCSKGIENDTLATMDEVLRQELPEALHRWIACLSGPSFAKEVAARAPTAVVVAARDEGVAEATQRALSGDDFRIYTTQDVVGVEVGGAVKNVIALGAGAADGLGFGHNTRAALITRGVAEMSRLAVARGANPLTLAGLAGMGDLVLTCTGDLSRNRSVGLALGRGDSLDTILGGMTMVAEGVKTTRSVYALSKLAGVEMPICRAVYGLLYEGVSPRQAVMSLMRRPLRPEADRP